MVRSELIDVLGTDHVRAARMKVLSPGRVLFRHALRNALLPAITVMALDVGYLLGGIIVVEQIFAFPGIGRALLVAITQRDLPSIQAGALIMAIARDEGPGYIVMREMLPNVVGPIVVEATTRVAFAIMALATLSFLGLGAQPLSAEWGLMVSEGRRDLFRSAWIMIGLGLAIAATAIAFNLFGDGLRDTLNLPGMTLSIGCEPRRGSRGVAGVGWRVGLGQDVAGLRGHAAPAAGCPRERWRNPATRGRPAPVAGSGDAPGQGCQDRYGIPGPERLAEPSTHAR